MDKINSKAPMAINISLFVLIVGLLITIYGYFKADQDSQAHDIAELRTNVTALQSKPIIDRTQEIKEIQSAIKLTTTNIAVLQTSQIAMDAKLNLIIQQSRDLNRKIDMYIARTPAR